MKRIFAVLVACVLCICLVAGCAGSGSYTTYASKSLNKSLNDSVLTKIGDYKITQAYYNFIYNLLYSQMAQYEQFYGPEWMDMEIEDGKTIGSYIKENTQIQIEQLAAASIIAKDKYGIKVNGDVRKAVEKQKKEIYQSYGTKQAFEDFLTSSHTTESAINTYLELYEVYTRLADKISEKGEECYIPEKELEEGFNEEYKDKLRVQHILISTQESESAPARTDEEALAIVNEVLAKLEKGEDFDSLIDEYDEDPGMTAGNYYTFGEGEMVPEFEQASKDLQIGEYTKEAVKTSYGYHIIKRYVIDTDTDEFVNYKNMKVQEKLTDVLEKQVEKSKIKWDTKAIDKYLKEWEKERAASKEETTPAE